YRLRGEMQDATPARDAAWRGVLVSRGRACRPRVRRTRWPSVTAPRVTFPTRVRAACGGVHLALRARLETDLFIPRLMSYLAFTPALLEHQIDALG
ncbi:MAG: hypothetical protein QOF85_914, partial [Solirubrobacterales bacterium]|nr:hypothetical protein [Solirubrobacterales bacterium]